MEERIELPIGLNTLPYEVQAQLNEPNDDLAEFKDYTLEFNDYTPIIVIKRNIKTTEVVNLSKALYPVVIEGDIEQEACVNASSDIEVKGNIGSGAKVSTQGTITAKNIGPKCIIDAVWVIKVEDIAEGAEVSSQKNDVHFNKANNAQITANRSIYFKEVDSLTKLTAQQGKIYIQAGKSRYNVYTPNFVLKANNSYVNQRVDTDLLIVNWELVFKNTHHYPKRLFSDLTNQKTPEDIIPTSDPGKQFSK